MGQINSKINVERLSSLKLVTELERRIVDAIQCEDVKRYKNIRADIIMLKREIVRRIDKK